MLVAVDTLPEDLRAVYRKSLRGELLPTVGDSRVGLAILQLAANKSPADTSFAPDQAIEVSSKGTRKTLRELATWFIARSQLRSTHNYYALLGLTRDATSEQIRDHYRRLIALVHPDVRPDDFPNDAAVQVNLAYETLSDEIRRKTYDRAEGEPQATVQPSTKYRATAPNLTETKPRTGRFGWLRSRSMLVWGAAALVLPIALVLLSLSEGPKHPEIIVAKAKSESVNLRESKTLAQATATTSNEAVTQAKTATGAAEAPVSIALNASPSLSLVEPDAPKIREQTMRDTKAAIEPGVQSVTARTEQDLRIEKSLQPVPNRDALVAVDELLVMLSESIESGQPDRFARLFARDVVGRSKIVGDFTQVFEATKRREVRFIKIDRFRPVGGAPTFAGQIEILMAANDGSVSRQQMFVQGSVNLYRGKPVLTSWSSHPI